MKTIVIDRRNDSKKSSSVEKFLKKQKSVIKSQVLKRFRDKSISDETGTEITIKNDEESLKEPLIDYEHGTGYAIKNVWVGNGKLKRGQKIRFKQEQGSGAGAGNGGGGEDNFTFDLSYEEFIGYLFDNLKLHNLENKINKKIKTVEWVNGGITSDGSPTQLDLKRTMISSKARKTSLIAAKKAKIKELELLLISRYKDVEIHAKERKEIIEEIKKLKNKLNNISFVEDFDLKYNVKVKREEESNSAVMFCLMDVSGSMGEDEKHIAKQFYLLTGLLLKRNYKNAEIVFVRYHNEAKECDEEEFFNSVETGGTVASQGMKVVKDISLARYPADQWNTYIMHITDGDNWMDDSILVRRYLELMSNYINHYYYIEIDSTGRSDYKDDIFYYIKNLMKKNNMTSKLVTTGVDVWDVFKDMFDSNIK